MILLLLSCTQEPEIKEDSSLIGLLITPNKVILPVGSGVQLEAIGLTSDRETRPLTDTVEWNVEHYSIATISDSLDEEGLLKTHTEGNTRIYAQFNDLSSPYVEIVVTEATLERLSIHPNEVAIVEGETIDISATAYFSNGSSGDFTQQVRWVTEDGSVAQVPESGQLKGVEAGETRIFARYEDTQSESIPVDVQPFYENGTADLIIEEASGFVYDGVAHMEVRIKNQGNASAHDFWVDAWGQRTVAPEEYEVGDEYHAVPYLSPNHYATLSFSFPFGESIGESWIQIDTSNTIEESRESNNSIQFEIVSVSTDTEDDLSIDFFDTAVNSDGTRSFFIDVTNNGSDVIPYFFVDLYPNQENPPEVGTDGSQYIAVEDLAPGETAWADFIYQGECSDCTSWCMVDSLNFLIESNEENNIAGPLSIP
jgi:hypothetical protein